MLDLDESHELFSASMLNALQVISCSSVWCIVELFSNSVDNIWTLTSCSDVFCWLFVLLTEVCCWASIRLSITENYQYGYVLCLQITILFLQDLDIGHVRCVASWVYIFHLGNWILGNHCMELCYYPLLQGASSCAEKISDDLFLIEY